MKRILLFCVICVLGSCSVNNAPVTPQVLTSTASLANSSLKALPACEIASEPPLSVIQFFDWYAIEPVLLVRVTKMVDVNQYLSPEPIG